MTAQAMRIHDESPDPRELSKGAEECCHLAFQHVVAKTGMTAEIVRKHLEQGEQVCSEYFMYAWTKAMAPRIAVLCPEVCAAYLLTADGDDGDSLLRDLVIVATRKSEAFVLLCEGLNAEFDHIRKSFGLRFSIFVHGLESSEVARGERVAAALTSTNAPALKVWSSQSEQQGA